MPLPQGDGADNRQLYLTPQAAQGVSLQTHVADFELRYAQDGRLWADLDALYRLRNPSKAPVAVSLRLAPAAGGVDTTQITGLALTAAGQPLALTPSADGAYLAQVQAPADGTLDLTLTYSVPLAAGTAPALVYAPSVLAAWPGSLSLRVQLLPPPGAVPESWLDVAPAGWSFAPSGDPQRPYVRWLYDGRLPRTPFVFRLVAPATWSTLQAAAQEAVPGAPTGAFLRLAELVTQVMQSIPTDATAARESLYAQALAAYMAGVDNLDSGGTPADQIASLHRGLAALYRDRVLGADGRLDPAYAELMVDAAGAALLALSPAAPPETAAPEMAAQRAELLQWQAEGLRTLLNSAQRRQDWPAALALLERLAALPSTAVNPAVLAQERRALLVQQALQLLERGQRDEAMALAGEVMGDVDLMPPAHSQSLFASWQMSVTADTQQTAISLLGVPAAGQQAAAQAALDEVLAAWQSLDANRRAGYAWEVETQPSSASDGPVLALRITLPVGASGLPLADVLPARIDWALLRAVLLQAGPALERKARLLGQQVALSQSLDLRTAGERWLGMAAELDRLANQFTAEGAGSTGVAGSSGVDDGEERALRAQIQAIHYRHAAQQWRELASDSWLRTTLQVAGPSAAVGLATPQARTWLTTVGTPPQMQRLQAHVVDGRRVVMLLISVLFAVSASAGLLWWLL